MIVERIESLDDPRVAEYRNVRDADLLGRRGLFIAEGRLVVRALLTGSTLKARSVFLTEPAYESLRDVLEGVPSELPVYLADQAVMNRIVGFDIHRGCLAAGQRPAHESPERVLEWSGDGPVLILEDLTNHDNVGGVFRCAAAFGVSCVLLSPKCCDPLYRKAIRVSMGAALRVPFARIDAWPQGLEGIAREGVRLVGMTPASDAVEIGAFARMLHSGERIGLMLGTEGAGLSAGTLAHAAERVRIAIEPDVDSLNVVCAAAVALHRIYPSV